MQRVGGQCNRGVRTAASDGLDRFPRALGKQCLKAKGDYQGESKWMLSRQKIGNALVHFAGIQVDAGSTPRMVWIAGLGQSGVAKGVAEVSDLFVAERNLKSRPVRVVPVDLHNVLAGLFVIRVRL